MAAAETKGQAMPWHVWLRWWLRITWWRFRSWKRMHFPTCLDVEENQQREEVAALCRLGNLEQLHRASRIFEDWRDMAAPGREKLHALWLLGMLNDEIRKRG